MVNGNFLLRAPDILEEINHNLDCLVPYQPIIRLPTCLDLDANLNATNKERLTSENAGATTFLWRFHSSPSDAMMFPPQILSEEYGGLGKRCLLLVTSYSPIKPHQD